MKTIPYSSTMGAFPEAPAATAHSRGEAVPCTSARSGVLKLSLMALAASMLGTVPAFSQSAEGLDTTGLVPVDQAADAAAVPSATPVHAETMKKVSPAEAGPSRYAGSGPELTAYVERLASTFSIRNRTTDPFGRYQDPEFKAPEPKIINSKQPLAYKAPPPMPFADVVAAIQVNVVIPAQKRFLVSTPSGARSFKTGDVFPIQLPNNGKKIRVQVKSVTAPAILFANLDTGETAVLKPDIMPAGMQKGTGGITAPGIQPAGADSPIEIGITPPISSN